MPGEPEPTHAKAWAQSNDAPNGITVACDGAGASAHAKTEKATTARRCFIIPNSSEKWVVEESSAVFKATPQSQIVIVILHARTVPILKRHFHEELSLSAQNAISRSVKNPVTSQTVETTPFRSVSSIINRLAGIGTKIGTKKV